KSKGRMLLVVSRTESVQCDFGATGPVSRRIGLYRSKTTDSELKEGRRRGEVGTPGTKYKDTEGRNKTAAGEHYTVPNVPTSPRGGSAITWSPYRAHSSSTLLRSLAGTT